MKTDFSKIPNLLVPAVVQDLKRGKVLMLGFMNQEAYEQSLTTGRVTFFSRSKKRLWVKGETSGNYLTVVQIIPDCDRDTLLVKATPSGPVCHKGTDTCFAETNERNDFISKLETIIQQRKDNPTEESYTSKLFQKGINKIAQKVGEESVELVIEAKDNNIDLFKNEAADLLFHYLVLLQAKGIMLKDIEAVLKERHK